MVTVSKIFAEGTNEGAERGVKGMLGTNFPGNMVADLYSRCSCRT